jgi:hypothetical protein
MKVMFEVDTGNVAETQLIANFLIDAADLSVAQAKTAAETPRLVETGTLATSPYNFTAGSPERAAFSEPKPSNVVPIKPEPAAPPVPGAVPTEPEFDANGMQWDARIHSGNKAKTIGGAWKNRRGVAEADRLAVEATLPRKAPTVPATNALPPPPPGALPPPPPPTPEQMGVTRVAGVVIPPGASLADAVTALKTPPPPPGGVLTPPEDDEADLEPDAPPMPPVPPAAPAIDFPTLMVKVSEAMAANLMTVESVQAKIKPLGIDTLFALSGRDDLVVPAAKALGFA